MMVRSLVAQLAVWAVVACGQPPATQAPATPPPPTPPADRTHEPDVAALVRRADEALAAMQRPDYRRPFVQEPDTRKLVGDLYLEACRAGDRSSCWMADAVDPSERAATALRGGCLAGDLMSCRALRRERSSAPDKRLRGWASHDRTCEAPDCREILRQECEAGFPGSCNALSFLENDEGRLAARAMTLATEGCRAGLLVECRWLVVKHDGDRELASEQLCSLAGEECRFMYTLGPIKARDSFEHGCQYGRGEDQYNSCLFLELGYYEMGYPEPYPGRALEIARWVCERGTNPARCIDDPRSWRPQKATP